MTNVYSLYDRVAGFHYSPFTSSNYGTAVRSVAASVRLDNTIVAQHPADFDLFSLGTFDESLGLITVTTPIRFVGRVSSFLDIGGQDEKAFA